jgi:hypothetical protein
MTAPTSDIAPQSDKPFSLYRVQSLLGIPSEIRNKIYEYIFDGAVLSAEKDPCAGIWTKPGTRSTIPNLLLVCQFTYSECRDLLYSIATIRFVAFDTSDIWRRRRYVGSDHDERYLSRRIRHHITKVVFDCCWIESMAEIVMFMPTLKDLTIHPRAGIVDHHRIIVVSRVTNSRTYIANCLIALVSDSGLASLERSDLTADLLRAAGKDVDVVMFALSECEAQGRDIPLVSIRTIFSVHTDAFHTVVSTMTQSYVALGLNKF